MHSITRPLTALSTLLLFGASLHATEWYVAPGAAPLSMTNPGTDPLHPIPLQQALSDAVSKSGDIIKLEQGIYPAPAGGFVIQNKDLTIHGSYSRLDGDPLGTGVFSHHILILTQATVQIDNIEIVNGRAVNPSFPNTLLKRTGGGVHCVSSSISFRGNCTISDCQAELAGGGIFAQNSIIDADGLRLVHNSVLGGGTVDPAGPPRGGAVMLQDSVFRGKNLYFIENAAGAVWTGAFHVWTQFVNAVGGAIFCTSSDVTVYSASFDGNVAANRGGALFFESTVTPGDVAESTRFANCLFLDNRAGSQFPGGPSPNGEWPGLGGAGYLVSTPTAGAFVRWNNCSFTNNLATGNDPTFANESCSIHAELTPGGIPTLSVLTNTNIDPNIALPGVFATQLGGRHRLNFCAVPFVAPGNGNIDNHYPPPPTCPAVYVTYLVDVGSNALIPMDYLDLDEDMLTQEPVPFDGPDVFGPNARVVTGCTQSVVDIGAAEYQ